MQKNKVFLSCGVSALLLTISATLFVNFNLQRQYQLGDYVPVEDAYFVEKIDDPTGLVKAQKFVTPTDNKYNTQKTRSLGSGLIGDIESVWNSYTGQGTTIAIIDDGFDYNHPDYLRSNGTSAILSTSRYYYESDSSTYYKSYATDPSSIGQDWENDGYGDYEWSTHGTATSTTAAAPMNNGGGVGIAPEADILALKIDFSFAAIKAAIQYAVSLDVDVINMSLGAYAENFTDGFGDSQTGTSSVATYLESVCQDAYNNGIIVVAAAGNEATSRKLYPACNAKVIGVGALGDYTNKGNATELAEFTNYVSTSQTGEINIDILAPGYVYTAHQTGTQAAPAHSYDDTQGTSFSSPIIAGAAALWKDKYPQGTPTQFISKLQSSADGIGTYKNKMINVSEWVSSQPNVGPSNITNGRLNVANLLDISEPNVTTVQSNLNMSVGEKRQISIEASNGTITYSSSNPSIANVTSTGLVSGLAAGNATITVTATKNELTATATIAVVVNDVISTSSMVFNPSSVTLGVGDTYNAEETLIVAPNNASRIFLFESENESVATVNEDTGLVTAVGVGTAIINAISVYGDGYTTLTILVNNTVVQTGTLNFGNSDGKLNVNSANVSGTDNLNHDWVVATTGTASFTPSSTYSQIGSSKSPASSIIFTMTLPSSVTFTSVTASFGGFSGSSANVTIKVGSTTIGTGNVVAESDTTTNSNTTASGSKLVVSLTNITKGIKAYLISYTCSQSGSVPSTPTLTGINVTNTRTYHPGETIAKSDINVQLAYSDGSSSVTTDFAFASDGYRFTYEDTNGGSSSKSKQFSIIYNSQSYSFTVNVSRVNYAAPSGTAKLLSSSQFSSSTLSKISTTPSNASVTIGELGFTVSTNAYVYTVSSTSYLSFGKGVGSIQNTNAFNSELISMTVNQLSSARQDGVLTISKDGSSWITYSSIELTKGGYRYFKYAYTTTSTSYSNVQSISFTLSGSDNPTNVANYIMFEDTNNQCVEKLNIAVAKLNTLSSIDKNTFWTSSDYVISSSKERLLAWARHEGKEFIFSNDSFQIVNANQNFVSLGEKQINRSVLYVAILSMMSVVTISSYLYIRRKKED